MGTEGTEQNDDTVLCLRLSKYKYDHGYYDGELHEIPESEFH
jgi:hypothetical protein